MQWYVLHNGKEIGPMSSAKLKQLAMEGKIVASTLCRRHDRQDFVEARKIAGLSFGLELIPSPPPTAQPVFQNAMPCPFCDERISPNAIKCKHCGEFLDGRARQQAPAPVVQTFVSVAQQTPRWNPAAAAILSLIIPGLGQAYKGQFINGAVWFVVVVIGYALMVVPGIVMHVLCVAGACLGDPYRK